MRTQLAGRLRHKVTLQGPSTLVPDGQGGFTSVPTNLDPATWHCSIEPATARDLERVTAGTVTSVATHVVKGRYHPGINSLTTIAFGARTLAVKGVANPEERNEELILICTEVVS